MADRNFIQENEAARLELSELIARLDEQSFARLVGSDWTISTSLCHLAFWDQRVLFLLKEWERSGHIDDSQLGPQTVQSLNYAVNVISRAVAGPASAELALNSASAVDSELASMNDEFIDQLVSAGFERYLRRYLHRHEHLRNIRRVLKGQDAASSLNVTIPEHDRLGRTKSKVSDLPPPAPELYTLLHNERVSLAKENRSLETTVATAVAALYAWLATAHIHGAVWYIGPTLVFLGAFRAGVLGGRILFIKDYLRSIEQKLLTPDIGYESYFQTNATLFKKWYLHLRFTAAAIWGALLVASAFAPHFLDR